MYGAFVSKPFDKNSKDVGMALKVQNEGKCLTRWEINYGPYTPYIPTPLNVGTMVTAPLCKSLSLSLFQYFLYHPYILTIIFLGVFLLFSTFCTFYSVQAQIVPSNDVSPRPSRAWKRFTAFGVPDIVTQASFHVLALYEGYAISHSASDGDNLTKL